MPPEHLMPEDDFEYQLARFLNLSIAAADLRREAARLELERAEWVGAQPAAKVEAGVPITRADKEVHADPAHRQYQRQIATSGAEAAKHEIVAKVAEFRCRMLIAERARTPLSVGEVA